MRRLLIFVFLVILLALPVRAMEFAAPEPPAEAAELLPREADSFGEGLWKVLSAASELVRPSIVEALECCVKLCAAMVLTASVRSFSTGASGFALELAGTGVAALLLLEPSRSLIHLGVETVRSLREYGLLLLGVMTSALAARGGVTASTALYAGTAFFDSVLSSLLRLTLIPALWMYLALAIARGAVGEGLLTGLSQLLRRIMEWILKGILYLFTGYMTITGVVSGTADAAAGKAARIAISAAVPVVGGILSDASDAVLLGAATLGSGAGIWGVLTVLAIFCAPVIRIGSQYLMLKLTAAVGQSLGAGRCAALVGDFAAGMGILVAMVSTQAVLLLISTVCFLRGVAG